MKHAKAAQPGYIALSKEGIRLGQAKCNTCLEEAVAVVSKYTSMDNIGRHMFSAWAVLV